MAIDIFCEIIGAPFIFLFCGVCFGFLCSACCLSFLRTKHDTNKRYYVEFKAPHNLYLMMAMLLACSKRYTKITLFVSNEVVYCYYSMFNDDYAVHQCTFCSVVTLGLYVIVCPVVEVLR